MAERHELGRNGEAVAREVVGGKRLSIMDKWVKRFVVPSSSGGGEYIVSQDRDGNWACSCPGWTRHVPRTDCKHIREVRDYGGGETLTEHVIGKLAGRRQ